MTTRRTTLVVILALLLLGLPTLRAQVQPGWLSSSVQQWQTMQSAGSGGAGLPAGAIIVTLTACPMGYTEVAALAGKTLIGTTAAAADVGTTGGVDTITTVINHTHVVTVNDPGHSHGMAEGQTDGAGTLADRSNVASAAAMVTDSATTGITATTANPAGGVASLDNRSAFTKVIFCSKDS